MRDQLDFILCNEQEDFGPNTNALIVPWIRFSRVRDRHHNANLARVRLTCRLQHICLLIPIISDRWQARSPRGLLVDNCPCTLFSNVCRVRNRFQGEHPNFSGMPARDISGTSQIRNSVSLDPFPTQCARRQPADDPWCVCRQPVLAAAGSDSRPPPPPLSSPPRAPPRFPAAVAAAGLRPRPAGWPQRPQSLQGTWRVDPAQVCAPRRSLPAPFPFHFLPPPLPPLVAVAHVVSRAARLRGGGL